LALFVPPASRADVPASVSARHYLENEPPPFGWDYVEWSVPISAGGWEIKFLFWANGDDGLTEQNPGVGGVAIASGIGPSEADMSFNSLSRLRDYYVSPFFTNISYKY
jgi:hypothetical protein